MQVAEMLDRKGSQVYAVRPDCTVRDTAALLAERNIGTTIVIGADGALVGIISERDVVRALTELGGAVLDLPVGELMTRSVVTCGPEATVNDALSLMASWHIRHLPVVRDGEVLGLISVRDVLETRLEGLEESFAAMQRARRQSAQARQHAEVAKQAHAEFLANMSRRLNPQLDMIIDTADEIIDKLQDDPRALDYLAHLHTVAASGRRAAELIDELALLSRLETGQAEPAADEVNLGEVLATCLEAVAEQADRKGVALDVAASGRAAALTADTRMVKRMLLGLLANGVKFTPTGGTVSLGCAVDKDGGVHLSVTDTGIGIAPEYLAKVVEPFYQATTLMRGAAGAGLGLALADAMIRAHGGALTLESKIGIGTTATLHFPPARTAAAPVAHRRATAHAAA